MPRSPAKRLGSGNRWQSCTAAWESRADLWLAAAIGLFALAIGYDFTSAAGRLGPGIAAGLLEAAGVAGPVPAA